VREISPPPGFDLRTVQPVTSRYTVYVITARHTGRVEVQLHSSLTSAPDGGGYISFSNRWYTTDQGCDHVSGFKSVSDIQSEALVNLTADSVK
jgi:hypothetical protein